MLICQVYAVIFGMVSHAFKDHLSEGHGAIMEIIPGRLAKSPK